MRRTSVVRARVPQIVHVAQLHHHRRGVVVPSALHRRVDEPARGRRTRPAVGAAVRTTAVDAIAVVIVVALVDVVQVYNGPAVVHFNDGLGRR